jgi:hypothetical protein
VTFEHHAIPAVRGPHLTGVRGPQMQGAAGTRPQHSDLWGAPLTGSSGAATARVSGLQLKLSVRSARLPSSSARVAPACGSPSSPSRPSLHGGRSRSARGVVGRTQGASGPPLGPHTVEDSAGLWGPLRGSAGPSAMELRDGTTGLHWAAVERSLDGC